MFMTNFCGSDQILSNCALPVLFQTRRSGCFEWSKETLVFDSRKGKFYTLMRTNGLCLGQIFA